MEQNVFLISLMGVGLIAFLAGMAFQKWRDDKDEWSSEKD